MAQDQPRTTLEDALTVGEDPHTGTLTVECSGCGWVHDFESAAVEVDDLMAALERFRGKRPCECEVND